MEKCLTVLGLGPGAREWITPEAMAALEAASDLVGYQTYLDLVPDLPNAPRFHPSGNRVEIERAREALALAARGRRAVLVTSGDPGIFAMASAVYEVLDKEPENWAGVEVRIVPGISAMQAAAARAGAPLGHDFCVISLSDIRKPWAVVERRLVHAAQGDFVIALYNPASRTRREQIEKAICLLLEHRSAVAPVVIAQNLGRAGERVLLTRLDDVDTSIIDMRSLLIIGSSQSRHVKRQGEREFVYAPRSYGA
ncbi:MAG TPA: precorrin-3B C(17)-methyltransferase [Rhizobiales bacterium]|nr:precorrin-3B C(17)-methyltransferase [Hyphomicrobiales bacterium]